MWWIGCRKIDSSSDRTLPSMRFLTTGLPHQTDSLLSPQPSALNRPAAALPAFRRALMLERDPVERGQLEGLVRELEGAAPR